MIEWIVLRTGDKETGQLTWIVFGNRYCAKRQYGTPADAVMQLAVDYYTMWKTLNGDDSILLSKCCLESVRNGTTFEVEGDSTGRECQTCGQCTNFCESAYREFIEESYIFSQDSYFHPEGVDVYWSPLKTEAIWGAPPETIVVIQDGAENVLLDALREELPDLLPDRATLKEYEGADLDPKKWRKSIKLASDR